VAVGDVFRVQTVCATATQVALNNFHYRIVTETAPGLLQSDVALAWNTRFNASFKACVSSAAAYKGTMTQKVSGALPLNLPTPNPVGAGIGGTAGEMLPGNICGIITWRSLFAGRANRGRSFMPFPGEADNDINGHPNAAYLTKLGTFADLNRVSWTVTFGADTASLQLCIWHAASRTLGVDLFNRTAQERWGQQHRRGDYGRPNVPPL